MRNKIIFISLLAMFSFSAHAVDKKKNHAEPEHKTEAVTHTGHVDDLFPETGDIGATFSIPAGGGPTVGATYFIDPMHAAHLDLGFDFNKPASGSNAVGFSIDAGYRMVLKKVGHVMVFMQPGLFIAKTAQTGDFMKLFTLAPNFGGGAEYFFNDNFSIAAITGVALTFKNEFKQIRFTTGSAALAGSFYF